MAHSENKRVVLSCNCNGRAIATAWTDKVEVAKEHILGLPEHRDHQVTVNLPPILNDSYEFILSRHKEGYVLYRDISNEDYTALAEYANFLTQGLT